MMNAMRRLSTPLKIVAARIVSRGCQWSAAGTMSPTVHTNSRMPRVIQASPGNAPKDGTSWLTLSNMKTFMTPDDPYRSAARTCTSRFASRLIGEREVVRVASSVSRSSSGFFMGTPHDTRGVSEHHATESAVMPAEIEQFPDRTRDGKMGNLAGEGGRAGGQKIIYIPTQLAPAFAVGRPQR